MIIYKAHLEMRKFAFEAFGASEPEAREALQRGLRQHEQQCGLRAGQMDQFFAVDVQVTPMEFGARYCDGRRL